VQDIETLLAYGPGCSHAGYPFSSPVERGDIPIVVYGKNPVSYTVKDNPRRH